MAKKPTVPVEPAKVDRNGRVKKLPLPTHEEAYAVYIELRGSIYGVRQHYLKAAPQLGYRVPAEKTLYDWQEKLNWKEKYQKHLKDAEAAVERQAVAVSSRKVLDARKEVEDVCGLIFERMKEVIPTLPIKTASDVRQLGLVTKDYLEIRDAIEGTGKDKEAEEVAKSAEQRVEEAAQQSAVLFDQLRQAHINESALPN